MNAMMPPSLDDPTKPQALRHEDRLAALTEVIDWAEGECAALNAVDAGICLQLARLALQARGAR